MTQQEHQPRSTGDRRQVERRRFPRDEFAVEDPGFVERRMADRRSGVDRRAD